MNVLVEHLCLTKHNLVVCFWLCSFLHLLPLFPTIPWLRKTWLEFINFKRGEIYASSQLCDIFWCSVLPSWGCSRMENITTSDWSRTQLYLYKLSGIFHEQDEVILFYRPLWQVRCSMLMTLWLSVTIGTGHSRPGLKQVWHNSKNYSIMSAGVGEGGSEKSQKARSLNYCLVCLDSNLL